MFVILMFFITQSWAILGGQDIEDIPDLVRLDFANDTMCTGIYINPDTILTAAHCVYGDQKIAKILGEKNEIIDVKQLKNIIHPEFHNGSWPSRDVAYIKTTPYAGFVGKFSLAEKSSELSGEAHILGCGIYNFEPKQRKRAMGKNSFFRLGSVLIFFGEPAIAPNDSGGPIIDFKTKTILGIASKTTRTENSALPSVGFATATTSTANSLFLSQQK